MQSAPFPTVSLGESFEQGMAFIHVQNYLFRGRIDPQIPVEIEMKSGNRVNDGLRMSTTLCRLTPENAKKVRDAITDALKAAGCE